VLTARPMRGEPTPSPETTEVRWSPVSSVAGLKMDQSMRLRVNDYLAGKSSSDLSACEAQAFASASDAGDHKGRTGTRLTLATSSADR
jgi:hypothetical protein